MKKIKPINEEDGETVYDLCSDEANSNFIRAARLKKASEDEDEAAKKKLELMQKTPMYRDK